VVCFLGFLRLRETKTDDLLLAGPAQTLTGTNIEIQGRVIARDKAGHPETHDVVGTGRKR
jgi:hypothetical protein